MILSPVARLVARYLALAYVVVLVAVPVGLILWRTFAPGFGAFAGSISTPAAISALNLSLLVVAIVVPLNVVFGVPTALLLARKRFRGKSLLQAIIDLPFAVSPVVIGVALILLWGSAGLFGNDARIQKSLAYNTSKGAVVNMTRALAAEWGQYNITVNAIAPGFFPSKMTKFILGQIGDTAIAQTPLARLGGEEDLKGLAALLASDAAAHITGQIVAVDGGATAI